VLTHFYRAVLTNLGEKMSDDEVDELLKAVDTSSGEINYTGMTDSTPSFVESSKVFSLKA
jgi:Ca2+-binding EF-hand superfamily protein